MKQINWGIIGCGNVTEKKSGPAFNKIDGSKLIAVMRRNSEKAEDYAKRHTVPFWYDDADKLINHPDINAIYIATPPDSHLLYTKKAAKAKKAIYVEKPMALNSTEAKEMVELCKKNKVPLFVAYYRRALPYHMKVREILESGVIGEPRFVLIHQFYAPKDEDMTPDNLPWRVVPSISGGGYFVDLASHQLDYLDLLFGRITDVCGNAYNQAGYYKAEDIVTAVFKFESGVIGNGIWCYTVSKKQRTEQSVIAGTKGRITFSYFHYSPIKVELENESYEIKIEQPENIQYPLIKTVVEELQGKGKCISTGESALRTSIVIDKILESYRKE